MCFSTKINRSIQWFWGGHKSRLHGRDASESMCQVVFESHCARNDSTNGPSSTMWVCRGMIFLREGSHHPPGPLHLSTWQQRTLRHPSFSHPDTSGIYLHTSFNYSAAEQLWLGIRAIDSRRNARQLGWKRRNQHCDTSHYHPALCDYRHSATNSVKDMQRMGEEREERIV